MSIKPTKSWADIMDEDGEQEKHTLSFVPAAASPPISRVCSKEKPFLPTNIQVLNSKKEEIPNDLRNRLVFIVGTQGFDNTTLLQHLKANDCHPILLWCLPDRDSSLGLRPFAHAVFRSEKEADDLITRKKLIINPHICKEVPNQLLVEGSDKQYLDFRVFEPFLTRNEQNPVEAKIIGHISEQELRDTLKYLDDNIQLRKLKFGKQNGYIVTFSNRFSTSIAIRRLNNYKTTKGVVLAAEYGRNIRV